MTKESLDIVIGCVLIVGALALMTFLTFWSRRTIDRIARSKGRSAREIRKELTRGR